MSTQKKLTGYAGIMQAAADAWPEDEAHATFCTLRDRLADSVGDAEETAYNLECFGRDVAHMRRVFGRHSDDASLIARYNASLAAQLAADETTKAVQLPA